MIHSTVKYTPKKETIRICDTAFLYYRKYGKGILKQIARELIASGYEAKVSWWGNLKISWKNAKDTLTQPTDVERRLK
jgi:hypothetical protein